MMKSSPLHFFGNILPGDAGQPHASAWSSPSNIALVKYWGKKAGQVPANASLSLSLTEARTQTRLSAEWVKDRGGIRDINGMAGHPFAAKLEAMLDRLAEEVPVVRKLSLRVETENTFPHSAGIASSASGISAFALCLFDILGQQAGIRPGADFFRAVSYASRLGSGSACRSVYGGFTVWGHHAAIQASSDDYAVDINHMLHAEAREWKDSILLVSSRPKGLSSTSGHGLMNDHPYAAGRYSQAGKNLELLAKALQSGDFDAIAHVSEEEALSLHALLMTSGEAGMLLTPASLEIIQRVRAARKAGLAVFFTIDAGPNIHLIYPGACSVQAENFIRDSLLEFCEKRHVIYDQGGSGPHAIHD